MLKARRLETERRPVRVRAPVSAHLRASAAAATAWSGVRHARSCARLHMRNTQRDVRTYVRPAWRTQGSTERRQKRCKQQGGRGEEIIACRGQVKREKKEAERGGREACVGRGGFGMPGAWCRGEARQSVSRLAESEFQFEHYREVVEVLGRRIDMAAG
ncbi:hypothetical protein B0J12DRAFT_124093 [Macrophomina phaseolina]|uniref:Uncharacterized protein n=1 Tax=Macrophomina phaseolina TaxID=35725 RepID=A0ABQ8G883_9PEZI|nr:hypothetical protein B0J12DRAFT_124093 [Macrophomina phaseolina]